MAVYDVGCRKRAGRYSVVWDGRDGFGRMVVYMVRLKAGDFVKARKVVLVR